MTSTFHIDLFAPEFTKNPYPDYARLRKEAPIHRVLLPDGRPLWLVTRYEDVVAALKNPRLVKKGSSVMSPEQLEKYGHPPKSIELFFSNMLSVDPPDHTRLRTLVQKAFTPRRIEQLRPRIQEIANTLLDAVQPQGQMEFINAYAFPLPIIAIAELLGVPTEDREELRKWSNAAIEMESTEDRFALLAPAMDAFVEYLANMFARRREQPQDDLITALIEAEEAGDKLSEDELYAMVILLLIAGHETTVNLIGNGMLALLTNPDQMRLLQEQPNLIHTAIEEFLRYDGPVETSTARFASEDVTIGDQTIPRGEQVMVVLGSADRDEQRFADADTLDITRTDNRHVAFGHGIHFCLGAPLARLEGEIAINTVLRRFPNIRMQETSESLVWRRSLLIRGLQKLPVVF
ncbi:MAG: cytochrome P450 [Chloroflexi bacterium AL-W]|nr:cytochrome P450 [Chloroflexi bacterium AL-N1]NOK65251.1 cytochrome P450 [Chloroflexi bacterium AL-N10]NOK72484.1 cytochrome P450 [Chloroflexi bacterium AL-N5]NOK79430.1 cytochrome P450 [Chloroflexi bacterium AL-W]NOK87346.1 cytochrome P450 [Chloroflexi bacterium AL-N15]